MLVEGAGGLLVPMGLRPSGEPWTVADLAVSLGAPAVVVARAGLGTLNHTALTLEALERRAVPAGVVLGAWPAEPELVHWANLTDLVPNLVGAVPDGRRRRWTRGCSALGAGLAHPGPLRRARRLAGLGRGRALTVDLGAPVGPYRGQFSPRSTAFTLTFVGVPPDRPWVAWPPWMVLVGRRPAGGGAPGTPALGGARRPDRRTPGSPRRTRRYAAALLLGSLLLLGAGGGGRPPSAAGRRC